MVTNIQRLKIKTSEDTG